MKKIIFATFFLFCVFSFSYGQNSLNYVTKNSHRIITPSLKNLITIVDCSSERFGALMKQNGYRVSQDIQGSDYTHLVYENNSLDLYKNGGGRGAHYVELSDIYSHAQIFGALKNLYPEDALISLRKELSPYYSGTTSDGIEQFVVEDGKGGGYLIQIQIQQRTHYGIHIQHFAKLH